MILLVVVLFGFQLPVVFGACSGVNTLSDGKDCGSMTDSECEYNHTLKYDDHLAVVWGLT